MGRLIRRFIRAYNLTVKNKLEAGTYASPLAVSEASLIALQMFHKTTAITGTSKGGRVGIQANNASGTLHIDGFNCVATVLTGITLGGNLFGLRVETEVLGTGVVAAILEGIRVENYVESTATLSAATVYGIHITGSIAKDPSYYAFMRFDENDASTVDALIQFVKGAACLGLSYMFDLTSGAAVGAWATVGAPSGAGGYLKIRINGSDRYIALLTTSP